MVGETLELDAENAEPAYSYTLASSTTPVPRSGSTRMSSGVGGGGGGREAHWLSCSKGNKRPRSPLAAIGLDGLQSAVFGTSSKPQPEHDHPGGRLAPMEIESTPPRAGSVFGSHDGGGSTKRRLDLGPARQAADPAAAKPAIIVLDDSDEETSPPLPTAGQESRLNNPSRTGAAAAAADCGQARLHKRRRDRSRSRNSGSTPFKPSILLDLTDDRGPKGMCFDQPLDLCDSDDDGGVDCAGGISGKGPGATQAGAALSDCPVSTTEEGICRITTTSSPARTLRSTTPEPNVATPSNKCFAAPLTPSIVGESVEVPEMEFSGTERVETKQAIEVPVLADSLTSAKTEKPADAMELFPSARHQQPELDVPAAELDVLADGHHSLLPPTAAIRKTEATTTVDNETDFKAGSPVVSRRRSKYGPPATALFPLAASSSWKLADPSLRSILVSMAGHDPHDSLLAIEELLAREKTPSNAMCEAVVSALLHSRYTRGCFFVVEARGGSVVRNFYS